MRTNFYRVVLIALAITILGAAVFAQPPRLISYQGRVLDNTGAPVADGNHTFDFRIYTATSGGTQVWSELSVSIATTDGLFTYALGTSSIFSTTVFTNWPALYLQVTVDGQLQSPRTRLISAPFAETAGDLSGPSPYYSGPAWQTFPFDHRISTYGADGLEQIRLWGPSWGEIYLYDNQLTNVLAVTLTANNTSGGLLELNNPAGLTAIRLRAGSTGDASVQLPTDAIKDLEILDEPGITNKVVASGFTFTTSTAIVVVDSIDITIPTSGYVEVKASGYQNLFHTTGTRTQVTIGIDQTKTSLGFGTTPGIQSLQIPSGIPTASGSWHMAFSTTRVYSEAAGTHRYYLLAKRFSGTSSSDAVSYPIMSAKFFPTAYGSITGVASNANPNDLNAVSSPTSQYDQHQITNLRVQTLEQINAKQAAEMEALRLENERLRQIEATSQANNNQQ